LAKWIKPWEPSDWSVIEKKLWRILKDLKYLGFEHNYKIEVSGKTYYGDFIDPLLHICLEADGKKWHKDKLHEAIRDADFRQAGYEIYHFTGSRIMNDPEFVKDQIRKIVKEKWKNGLK
jgi:very-short-patch-repair endonuclease